MEASVHKSTQRFVMKMLHQHVRSVLSVGKSALEDEEHRAKNEMEEDPPEDASMGSGDMSSGSSDDTLNGSCEHRAEMEEDQLEDQPIPILESDATCVEPDEAVASKCLPKRGGVYKGGKSALAPVLYGEALFCSRRILMNWQN